MQNIITKSALVGTILLSFLSTAQGAKVFLEKNGQVTWGDESHYRVSSHNGNHGHLIHGHGITNITLNSNSNEQAPYIFARIVWEGNETVTFFDRPGGQIGNDIYALSGRLGDKDLFTSGSYIMHAKSVKIEDTES